MSFLKKTFLFPFVITLLIINIFSFEQALSKEPATRSGTIEDVTFEGLYTYITVEDSAGETFFVVTEVCKAVPESFLEVIRAEHYPKMYVPAFGGDVSDVYLAKLVKIDGREVIGATNEGFIPQGCKIIE